MSVVDWLWERSILIVAGIVSIWCLFRVADHLQNRSDDSRERKRSRAEQEHLRACCPPVIAQLASYVRRSESGLQAVLHATNTAAFAGIYRPSPEELLLTDLLKIVVSLAEVSEGPSWEQINLLKAFGAASFNSEISEMPRFRFMEMAEGLAIESSGRLTVLEFLAGIDHPDLHRLRDMYIGFAPIANEDDPERLAEVSEMIRSASRTKTEMLEDAVRGMEGIRVELAEQLNERYRQLLGVTPESTRDEIKVAYHRQVVLWHPDRLEGMAPELQAAATERLKEINEAYESISAIVEV